MMNFNSKKSVQSTDESSSSSSSSGVHLTNTIRLFQRMIHLKNPTMKSTINHSYNLHTFDETQDQYSVIIHFLDDSERTFYVDKSCKGIHLLNEIYNFLNIANEPQYFGLLIEDLTKDFAYRWLDSTKILKKQFPNNVSSYHLYFKIRFFLPDPSNQLDDEYIKYLYVLQIKKDILNGKIWCPRSIAAILASYLVQSELGDYDLNIHSKCYLTDFRFVPFQNSDFDDEVQQHHQQHQGQSSAQAESNYLRVASTLDMYGIELHKTSVKVANETNTIYNSIVELYIGVCATGITVFQNSNRINTFSWDQITKISFKRRTFYVQLVQNLNSIVFTLRNYHCCKYLWKSCVDYHTFFRLTSISSSPKKYYQYSSQSNEKISRTFERISHRKNIRSSTLPLSSSLTKTTNVFHSSVNISKIAPPKPPRQLITNEDKPKLISNSLTIKLKPDADGRYGFNVKGGEHDQAPTVISRIALNSPANRAFLHEGDIILAINQINIKNHSHEDIVNMIRNSHELELTIESCADNRLVQQSLESIRTDLFVDQFEKLPRKKEGFTYEIATEQLNFYQNRYKDILPYDQTRVILKTSLENDYINANYINMPIISTDTVNRYIATQGPLSTSCEPFWRMLWEEHCSLIIMLTTLFENGRIKCHQYWPNEDQSITYGSFTIRCNRERKENDLIYREFFFLNHEINEERIIYQIQNETWPDHGVPNDYFVFVNFILEIRELRKANKHLPILVHCSAGIGRTGVLILVETALCLIEANQPVYPLDIVRQMREQRLGMIQTVNQYQFACQAVLYAYDNGLINVR